MGSQSETLAIYIKITYLNKELWNIFQYRPQWAQLCQHVWASRNISVHFQIKYLASFLNPYQIHIFKTRKNDVFDVGKQYFCLSTHCDQLRSQRAKREGKKFWPILSAVLQLHYITSIKPNNIRLPSVDCWLWTVDNGFRSTPPWKNSSAHIVILKRFLTFAIAKMGLSDSSSLPLTPPCCEAWPPRLKNRGESPLKVTGMFVAFLKGRNCTFWVFNIFNHRGMAYGCA